MESTRKGYEISNYVHHKLRIIVENHSYEEWCRYYYDTPSVRYEVHMSGDQQCEVILSAYLQWCPRTEAKA